MADWTPKPAAERDFAKVPDPRVRCVTVRLSRKDFNELGVRALKQDVKLAALAADYLHRLLTS